MTLNDPDRWDAMGQIFLVDHVITLVWFDLERLNLTR